MCNMNLIQPSIFYGFLIFVLTINKLDGLEITIPQGTLNGVNKKTWTGKDFASFVGIPYAEPPVGDLRFEAPVPAGQWKGVLDATKYQSHCTQDNVLMNNFEVTGSEDCLYLNVYTPKVHSKTKDLLPVMFYTHGGGLMVGSGDDTWYGPEFLLDKDIVLVVYNYRLGAFGFLSTGDEVVPGNNGLKDQATALRWTKENIKYFGGDPQRITLFGNSAGGASTHYLLLSPLSKDLVKGAIIQSGTALGPWAIGSRQYSNKNTKALAKLLDCPTSSSTHIVNCLRKIDNRDIVSKSAKLHAWGYVPVIPFRPVVEPYSANAFISEKPEDIVKAGKAANVPIMISTTTEEGILKAGYIFNNSKLMDEFTKDFNRWAPFVFFYNDHSLQQEISENIKNFYFGNRGIDQSTTSEIIDMVTDSWFLHPLHKSIELHMEYIKQPVYHFLYGYRGPRSYGDVYGDPSANYGVCHSDELLYLFTTKLYGIYQKSALDRNVVKILTKLWTNFAKTGNPTPVYDVRLPTWEPVKEENPQYYYINNNAELSMINNMFSDRVNFWRNFLSFNVKEEL